MHHDLELKVCTYGVVWDSAMRKSTDSMLSPIITMVPQKSIIIILLISAILYVKFFFIIKQERITIISHRTYYNYFPYFGNIMLIFFTIKQERITTFNHTFTKQNSCYLFKFDKRVKQWPLFAVVCRRQDDVPVLLLYCQHQSYLWWLQSPTLDAGYGRQWT